MKLPDDVSLELLRHDGGEPAQYLRLLSAVERERLSTFRHVGRRTSFILGRAAARIVAGDRLEVDPAEVRLEVASDGAVDVVGEPYHLSISHGGSLAAAAIGFRPLGIDLERAVPRNPRLLMRILSEREQRAAREIPLAPELKAVLYWTLKEAVVKGMRMGLRCPMNSIEVEVDFEAGVGAAAAEGLNWELTFEEHYGYYVAVASAI